MKIRAGRKAIRKLIKRLRKNIAFQHKCYKMNQLYWLGGVIQEGPPPSYFSLHSPEEIQLEQEAALAAVKRMIAEDMEEREST